MSLPAIHTRTYKSARTHGNPGSEKVGNGVVDGKQPPYVLPQILTVSTHMVGTSVVVTVTGVGVMNVVEVMVVSVTVSSEHGGAVKVGKGLVDGKQPPYVWPHRST